MSWTVYLENEQGKIVCDIGNYSYNVRTIYCKAFENAIGIHTIFGHPGYKAKDLIEKAISILQETPEDYMGMEKEYDGWGTFEGSIEFLQKIYEGCVQYPQAIVRVLQ